MEKLKMKKLNTLEKHQTNPFIVELKGKMYVAPKQNAFIAKDEAVVDKITGETKDVVLVGRRIKIDRSQFAKIYFTELRTIYELCQCAHNVLMYISENMDYEQKVIVNPELCKQKIGYKTYQSVTKGLKELATKNIIATAQVAGVYWVNPLFVCKGERFAKLQIWESENGGDETENKISAMDSRINELAQIGDTNTLLKEYPNLPNMGADCPQSPVGL